MSTRGPGSLGLSSQEYREIIVEGNARLIKEKAEAIGTHLAREFELSTSQIRNIFGTVRQIEMNWGSHTTEAQKKQAARQLILLQPKLAYQAHRERGKGSQGVKALADVLRPAIDLVEEDHGRFQHFVDFFEAILAYHTAAGGQQ